jgi:hypothetical protein
MAEGKHDFVPMPPPMLFTLCMVCQRWQSDPIHNPPRG